MASAALVDHNVGDSLNASGHIDFVQYVLSCPAGGAGLPHAFNIIDGYNSSGTSVALIVCIGRISAGQDRALAALLVCTLLRRRSSGLELPLRGMLFAEDGGAYVCGAW